MRLCSERSLPKDTLDQAVQNIGPAKYSDRKLLAPCLQQVAQHTLHYVAVPAEAVYIRIFQVGYQSKAWIHLLIKCYFSLIFYIAFCRPTEIIFFN